MTTSDRNRRRSTVSGCVVVCGAGLLLLGWNHGPSSGAALDAPASRAPAVAGPIVLRPRATKPARRIRNQERLTDDDVLGKNGPLYYEDGTEVGAEQQLELIYQRDFLASEIPMLRQHGPEERLRTLKWMRTLPDYVLVGHFRFLEADAVTPLALRYELALRHVEGMIATLEQQGYRAPDLPGGFQAARIARADEPRPEPPSEPGQSSPSPFLP